MSVQMVQIAINANKMNKIVFITVLGLKFCHTKIAFFGMNCTEFYATTIAKTILYACPPKIT